MSDKGDWNMNEFEKASDAIEKDRDYRVNNENVIEFLRGATTATVSFSQGRFISKIKKLAEKYPDEVEIVAENKDGSIVAHIPTRYIKISSNKIEMSDEKREALRERFINNVLNNNSLEENDSKIDSNIKGDTFKGTHLKSIYGAYNTHKTVIER